MKVEHFNRAVLERFVDGNLPSEEASRIERHLAICSDCREMADQVSLLAKLEELDSWLHPGYDEVFERAAAGAANRLEGLLLESRSAEDLLAELLRESIKVRHFKIRSDQRFHSLKLCQLLQKRARENWFSDPTDALELGDLAVVVAQYLNTGRYGSSLVEDTLATSLAYLGNAFRITSDLRRAEQALTDAWTHHTRGGEDPFTEAEILRLFCSLRCYQDRNAEAVRLSDRAAAIYREGEDHHLEGTTLIQKGLALCYEHQFNESFRAIQAGLDRIEGDKEPQLLVRGLYDLILVLSKGGAPEGARKLLAECHFLYDVPDQRLLARLWWLDGQISRALGRYAEAEVALREVRELFLDHKLGCEVFEVSLELAEVCAFAGQRREARRLLSEVIPLGEALGLGQGTLAARLFYDQLSIT